MLIYNITCKKLMIIELFKIRKIIYKLRYSSIFWLNINLQLIIKFLFIFIHVFMYSSVLINENLYNFLFSFYLFYLFYLLVTSYVSLWNKYL